MKNINKMLVVTIATLISSSAFAQEVAAAATSGDNTKGFIGLAAGFALGLAGLGAALGQGKAASAALEGMARNPAASDKLFTPLILSLAFIEALAIYALVFAMLKV